MAQKPKKSKVKKTIKNALLDILTVFLELGLVFYALFMLIIMALSEKYQEQGKPEKAKKIEEFEQEIERKLEKVILFFEKPIDWLFKD